MSLLSRIFSSAKPLSLQGMTDWHCHILPGIDDGVQTMDEAIDILRQYEDAGIREVWLTPHIMEDIPNTTDALRHRFDELRQAYDGNVVLHLAAENMIDPLFMQRLESKDLLPIGPRGDMLLVETSYYNAPMRLNDTLARIKATGYHPLLAHPERYNYINDMDTYRRMHDMGVRFQLNLLSLTGHYGPGPRDKARRLLREGLVSYIGTDLHRVEHLEILQDTPLEKSICQQIGTLYTTS